MGGTCLTFRFLKGQISPIPGGPIPGNPIPGNPSAGSPAKTGSPLLRNKPHPVKRRLKALLKFFQKLEVTPGARHRG